jgi:hypothetical protein
MWVSLADGDCPLADWTALIYTAPIDAALVPIELRTTHHHVGAFWALNGRRDVAFLPSASAQWQEGYLPANVNAVAKDNASPQAVANVVAQIQANHPTVNVVHLDAIGIVTLETVIGNFADPVGPQGNVAQIDAAAQKLRQSNLFSSLDWSGLVFRIPNESWPMTAVSTAVLEPECLRSHTLDMRKAKHFTTLPSLAPPLGKGVVATTPVCN